MSRSLNKVQLIGNLTRDPELKYTPQGTAVCTFGLATNRQWTTDSGEQKEDVEFHRIVAWRKLAELCSQLLSKGRKVYLEGRLNTNKWTGQDGVERRTTEIVINDMLILDPKGYSSGGSDFSGPSDDFSGPSDDDDDVPDNFDEEEEEEKGKKAKKENTKKNKKSDDNSKSKDAESEAEDEEDIPF